MPGCACANRRSLGISHRLAMLGAECTYRLLLTPWRRSSVADETPDATLVDIMKSLGAESQQIKFAELYAALQQGVVYGQENPLVNFHASKLYEVQKYLALTSHQFQMTPFLMSKRSWDRLSEADRKAVQEAAVEATALQRKLSQEADDKLLADLKARCVQVTTPDRAPFARATADVTAKWESGPIGPYVKKVVAAAQAH